MSTVITYPWMPLPVQKFQGYPKDSIMGILSSTPEFSKFFNFVILAGLESIFSDPQLKSTVFVIPNSFFPKDLENVSLDKAHRYLITLMVPRLINYRTLYGAAVDGCKIPTRNNSEMLNAYIHNGSIYLNSNKVISKNEIVATNGYIYLVQF
jgi:hypothetical protein